MAGLTRSVAEARLAQQDGNRYQYANNNPVTYFDPDGLAPQRQGGQPPQAQIGIGGSGNKCPGPEAVSVVRGLLSQKTGCRLQFEVTCNGQSLDDVLKQVQFETGNCDGHTACTRFKPGHDPNPWPKSVRSQVYMHFCLRLPEGQRSNSERLDIRDRQLVRM
jgi:hypothetical protein